MTANQIVVGIDGSAMSEAAIRWAATEASARGATLRLVHAFVWPHFPVQLGGNDLAPGLRAFADRIVADSVELARKVELGITVVGVRVDGFPSPVLLGESRSADLVAIGSRGLGSTLGLLVGSTGVELAATAHCPIVVIHPDPPQHANRVVVGYDGSPTSRLALDFAIAFAARHKLTMRAVTVRPPDREAPVSRHDLAAAVHARHGDDSAEIIEVTGNPAEQLLSWCGEARLVVVGSRGRGGFKGLLLGSVSQTVLQQSRCPVAVIPPGAVRGD